MKHGYTSALSYDSYFDLLKDAAYQHDLAIQIGTKKRSAFAHHFDHEDSTHHIL